MAFPYIPVYMEIGTIRAPPPSPIRAGGLPHGLLPLLPFRGSAAGAPGSPAGPAVCGGCSPCSAAPCCTQ